VCVDARGQGNRAEPFKVATTILDAALDGGPIGGLFERRWDGEVDSRSVKSTMKMDVLRCKTPEMVRKEVRVHLLAYNLPRTVMAVAAAASKGAPGAISFKGAKQILTAFAPKLEAARPQQRAGLVGAMLKAVACHRVGARPGRWEPRARQRRPKPSQRLNQPRHVARLAHNRAKWYERLLGWEPFGGAGAGPRREGRRGWPCAAERAQGGSRGQARGELAGPVASAGPRRAAHGRPLPPAQQP
jgi:hypothetical protein